MALLLKVLTVAVKQLSKPLSSSIQNYMINHPGARLRAANAARFLHRIEVAVTRRAEGNESQYYLGKMTEEEAVKLASQIFSESLVFSVTLGAVLLEYSRQKHKELLKQQLEAEENKRLIQVAKEERKRLDAESQEQQQMLDQLMKRMGQVEAVLQRMEAQRQGQERQRRGLLGGFFAAKAL